MSSLPLRPRRAPFFLAFYRAVFARAVAVAVGLSLGAVACGGAVRSDLFNDEVFREPSPDAAPDASTEASALDGSTNSTDSTDSTTAQPDASRDAAWGDGSTDLADSTTAQPDASRDAADAAWVDAGTLGITDANAPDASRDGANSSDAGPVAAPIYTDPCVGSYFISCDPSCARGYGCGAYTCTTPQAGSFFLNEQSVGALPWRMRTPILTTPSQSCVVRCGGRSVATGVMRFTVDLPFEEELTVKVGAPWRVAIDSRYAFCISPTEAQTYTQSCVSRRMKQATVTIFTTAEAAPSRDVVFDVTRRTACGAAP